VSSLTAGAKASADPAAGLGLAGKVAIVTGAASGSGKATAELLARLGAVVTAVDVNGKGLAALDLGERGATDTADLSVPAACEQVVAQVLTRHGRLDILVNAAAILRRVPIAQVDARLWEEVMDTNLLSQFAMCRAAARPMRKQGSGRIVNISSTAAFNGGANNSSVYAIAKGGALALTKSLARQLAQHGVLVNAICPGGIDTPMGRQGFTDESWNAHYATNVPLRRAGKPEEVANAILFLVSDWGSYVTGHTLDVEGGLMLR
jgi:NAD(P)-dependent dehydrogenase (short-subunit alcohol dehydrogenase family)